MGDLLEGTDGQVRAAVVKVPDLKGGVKLLRRSIKHFYPIKLRPEEFLSIPAPGTQDDMTTLQPNEFNSRRPHLTSCYYQ